MSSHREAPEISKDPVADNTDVYAFVSPDQPNTVTMIANFIPLQAPGGGPNFYEFGDDVLYSINIDNNGDGKPDISYQFQFVTTLQDDDTFLYNTGPITSLTDPHWNRRQTYTVWRVEGKNKAMLSRELPCPPCNIGPLSTPNYASLAKAAVKQLGGGRTVFAGQRAEGFYVDLGAVFDLLDPRPLAAAHTTFGLPQVQAGPVVNTLNHVNVHSIAIQVPITELTSNGKHTSNAADPKAVIGVWATASRRKVTIRSASGDKESGPWVQVSRLGNPLFNEVIVPMAEKDGWNMVPPSADSAYAKYVATPEVAQLLPVLYPNAFPHLAALNASGAPRVDLEAILLTGIPSGLIPGFQNYTGATQADMLRLNTAIPPSSSPKINGLIAGDAAGFPNGRRVQDDVVAIALQAVAGAVYPLIDPSYTVDSVVPSVTDGTTPADVAAGYLSTFPYLGVPYDGFDNPA